MNLLYGDVVEVLPGPGGAHGKVRVGGVLKEVSLDLLTEPLAGDRVLVCEGIALSKVEPASTEELSHVSRHTR